MNHHFMPQERHKSDIAFYKAFKSERNFTLFLIMTNLVKASATFLIIITDVSVNGQPYSDITNALIFNIIASTFGLLLEVTQIFKIYSNPSLFLILADETGHAVVSQTTINFTSIDQCASPSVFLAENQIQESALTEQQKKLYISIAKTSLSMSIKRKEKWTKGAQNFYSTLSFFSMIYSIIILSTLTTNSIEKTALIAYVVCVGISQILVILVLFLICLIPLVCLGICLFVCCCKPSFGNEIQLQEREATTTDIVNVGGDCSICYQSITQNDKIFELQCSPMHVFHSECLRHWTKVKNTCPICRHDIPMGAKPPAQV